MKKNNLPTPERGKVDVLMGLQWGDEGKGKIVDIVTPHYDVVARFGGGPNAGHSLEVNGQTVVLNQIPSGALNQNAKLLIGNGCAVDPICVKRDLEKLSKAGIDVSNRLFFSERAKLITPIHPLDDAWSEFKKGEGKIGSTLRGITPLYVSHYSRKGLFVSDFGKSPNLVEELTKELYNKIESIKKERKDGEQFIHEHFKGQNISEVMSVWAGSFLFSVPKASIVGMDYVSTQAKVGERILAEGAQAHYLDIEQGDYPYVTSSHTTSAGACVGLNVRPQLIKNVYGVIKAYATRVGNGPFDDEFTDEKLAEYFRKKGHEYGATTGRSRRIGWTNFDLVRRAIMANGVTHIFINKVDVLFNEKFKIIDSHGDHDFEGLDFKDNKPNIELESFIELIEDCLVYSGSGTKLIGIGTGPSRDDVYYL
ncbi:MAG: adenylosuccinate synthetase [Candidatus Paceibacterota bacterium]